MSLQQMEGNLSRQYLQCYQQLQHPTLSKNANRTLLQLQASPQAWNIAYQLLNSRDQSITLHGAQLLSKKLNSPPPQTVHLQAYLHFLSSSDNKTALIWLCIAKILLHLSPNEPNLPANMKHQQLLQLIKEIPAALAHIRTQIPFDSAKMKESYLTQAIPIFKLQIANHAELVLECLDAFVSYGAKIRDPSMVLFLMSLPFQQGGHILQEVINREPFPNLNDEILFYLEAHRSDEQAFGLHLAFLRLADLSIVMYERFRSALEYVLTCLSQEDNEACSRISESYQLWHRIANQLKEGHLQGAKAQIVRDALLTLWNIVCKRSVLVVMPERNVVPQSPLSIDVDDGEQDTVCPSIPEPNKQSEYFRSYAGDFFVLVLESVSSFPQAQNSLFQSLHALSTSELLHLQLSIFIIVNLTPSKANLLGAAATIRSILSRATEMNEYICSKVVEMIGQLSSLLAEVNDVVVPMLLFLSSSLLYPSLSVIASVSCCSLLQQIEENGSQISEYMQQFLGHAYEVLFKDDCQIKVIQNLTRAMVIFIYKFKHNPEDYKAYLDIFSQRCNQLNREKRCSLIEAAASGQLWINSQQEIKRTQAEKITVSSYILAFAGYLEKQVQFFLQSLQSADKKRVFSDTVKLINMCLRTNAVGNGQIWANVCDYILCRYISLNPPLPIILTPLINLTKSAFDLDNPELVISVSTVLKKWHQSITDLLDFSFKQCDFSLSGTVLNLHLKTVQFLKKYPTCKDSISYAPERIVSYIVGIMNKQDIWEYQVFKNGLNYFLIVLQLGYPPLAILTCVLRAFGKLQETLWTSLDPILTLLYRNYGFNIYREVLAAVGSGLAQSTNPLHGLLREAFEKGEGKTIKNLFLSL